MPTKTTLEAVLSDYLNARVNLSPGYEVQLRVVVALFGRYLGRSPVCSDLDSNTVRAWMKWLLALPRSPRTVNGRTATLLSLWRFAHSRHLVKLLPEDIPTLREPQVIPCSYTDGEFAAMVMGCTGRKYGDIMRALLLVLWDTGVRLSAVRVAKRSDFNTITKSLVMTEPKTGKQQVYSLSEATVTALLALCPDDGSLLGWKKSDESLRYHLGKIQQRIGIPNDRNHKFHCVRKTKYTVVYQRYGLAIASQHLGHTSDLSKNYLDLRRLLTGEISTHLPPPITG